MLLTKDIFPSKKWIEDYNFLVRKKIRFIKKIHNAREDKFLSQFLNKKEQMRIDKDQEDIDKKRDERYSRYR